MKRKNYFLFAGCLLLVVFIASISLADPPLGKLPDQAAPALKAQIEALKANLAQCQAIMAQCNADLTQCEEAPPQFTILNPRPSRPPIIAVPLTPRLSNLENKTIAVVANYNPTMAPLAKALLGAAPGIKVIFISDLPVAAGQSPRPINLDPPIQNMSLKDFELNPKQADAVIVGNGF